MKYFKAISGFKYYNEKFMKKALLVLFLGLSSSWLSAQIVLTIEGEEIIDTETGISNGYNIPRSQPTIFTFRNNSITSVNTGGYMLQAGDEAPGLNNNNLDGEVITGNKFIWNGTDENSTVHAMFTGYNLDVVIKYNYLNQTPNGIQRKSDGMTDNSGIIAYNILNNPIVGIVVKGMNGVRIYNNTLYSERTPAQTGRGLIDVHTNTDNGLNAPSTGVKVFNNIFYTKYDTYCINVMDQESLAGFESDYNVFYCETGSPKFNAGGSFKTFEEWQAKGYDLHSVVMNPNFNNITDFVPLTRLDYGKNLGIDMQKGLSVDAIWSKTDPETTDQNGLWQVGARIAQSADEEIKIYFNEDLNLLYVLIPDMTPTYQTIKIHDINGRLILTGLVENGLNIIPVRNSFSTGIYVVALESNNLDRYTKKILIIG
jgi:hypothetical protein